jgi:hypothetical protein
MAKSCAVQPWCRFVIAAVIIILTPVRITAANRYCGLVGIDYRRCSGEFAEANDETSPLSRSFVRKWSSSLSSWAEWS